MPNEPKSNILQKIPVKEIREGIALLNDGSCRGVLMTSSLNFSLKSTEEQDAITYHYQEFLNSLDFPLQILIATRKFDVSDYLALLEKKRNEQDNELLKIQVTEYIEFIKGLTQVVNVMSTFFYLIVPFAQIEQKKGGGVLGSLKSTFVKKDKKAALQTFEEMKVGLRQRMDYIASGLSGLGLKSAALKDEELLDLLYQMYNPDAKEKPKMETPII